MLVLRAGASQAAEITRLNAEARILNLALEMATAHENKMSDRITRLEARVEQPTAALSPAPADYVLVPMEPTEAMITAAKVAWQLRIQRKIAGEQAWDDQSSFADNYRAMITAGKMP